MSASFSLEKPWVKDPDGVGSMHGLDEGAGEDLLQGAFGIPVTSCCLCCSLLYNGRKVAFVEYGFGGHCVKSDHR